MIDEKKLIKEIDELPLINERYDHKNGNIDFINGIETMHEIIINKIKEQPQIVKWIPCKDRLPGRNGKYICSQEIHSLSSGKIIGKSVDLAEFYDGEWRRARTIKVIAWQPLPEAYIETKYN